MEITSFTYDDPDDDGDITLDMSITFNNDSDDDIDLLRYSVLIQADSLIAAAENIEEDICIEAGEVEQMSISTPYVKRFESPLKGTVMVSGFHKSMISLGEVDIPQEAGSSYLPLNKKICDGVTAIGAGIIRNKPDSDADIGVDFLVVIQNNSSQLLDQAKLRVQVFKKNSDDVYDETPSGEDIPPHSCKAIVGWWRTKKGKLNGAKARLTLFWHTPVSHKSAEAVATPEE